MAVRNPFVKAARFVVAVVVTLVLLAAMSIGGLYFLLSGTVTDGSAVHARLESSLQNILGNQFEIAVGETSLSFDFSKGVRVLTNNLVVSRMEDALQVASANEVSARFGLLSALSNNLEISEINLDGVNVDARIFGDEGTSFLPSRLATPLQAMGGILSGVQRRIEQDGFKRISITNSQINGPLLGRKRVDPVEISHLTIEPDADGRFRLHGNIKTAISSINIESGYRKRDGSGALYSFKVDGVHLGEWLDDPATQDGLVAANSTVNASGSIPFTDTGNLEEPRITLTVKPGDVRLVKSDSAEVKKVELNFRLILDKNQIEMDPSTLEIGRLKASLIGGLKPVDQKVGYDGAILYDFIMRHGEFEGTLPGERVESAAFKVFGIYDSINRFLSFDDIYLTTKDGLIRGSGRFGLEGETPSLKAVGKTEGISVFALKQFWPFFVAKGARDWVHNHVIDGWVKSGTLQADIPPGVLFRLDEGAKLDPSYFQTSVQFEDVSFYPFGELPAIRKGEGAAVISGMQISANLEKGVGIVDQAGEVEVSNGSFVMPDFAATQKSGEISVDLDGDLKTVALIADANPLRAMQRMKVKADDFTGSAHANIVAKFPIVDNPKYQDVEWNVLLDLENASSVGKLAGRTISGANVLIDANPVKAQVSGTALIDGVNARLNLIEPVGKSGKTKQRREITAVLDADAREKLGVNLTPVVEGDIGIRVMQTGAIEQHEVDFTNAVVSLPWIGWSKGAGIPAHAKFKLLRKKKNYFLNDFSLMGPGFSGEGSLQFNDRKLISAEFDNISLNEGDSIQFKALLVEDIYEISASGLSFDARGLINKIINEGDFAKTQGERSVNLIANFGRVIGFGGRTIENAILLYESKNGWLNKIDLNGRNPDGSVFSVNAGREDTQTRFNIETNNAGHALAFTDIYSKMEYGQMVASLLRKDGQPFVGPVRMRNFDVVNESRLKALVSNAKRQIIEERGGSTIQGLEEGEDRVRFLLADANITKGNGNLFVTDGIIRNATIGLTVDGQIYDINDRIDIKGTFMPAQGLNLAISAIPLVGQLLSNGNKGALIGITYKLDGPRKNPTINVNPLSIVAPGVFNKVFEYQ